MRRLFGVLATIGVLIAAVATPSGGSSQTAGDTQVGRTQTAPGHRHLRSAVVGQGDAGHRRPGPSRSRPLPVAAAWPRSHRGGPLAGAVGHDPTAKRLVPNRPDRTALSRAGAAWHRRRQRHDPVGRAGPWIRYRTRPGGDGDDHGLARAGPAGPGGGNLGRGRRRHPTGQRRAHRRRDDGSVRGRGGRRPPRGHRRLRFLRPRTGRGRPTHHHRHRHLTPRGPDRHAGRALRLQRQPDRRQRRQRRHARLVPPRRRPGRRHLLRDGHRVLRAARRRVRPGVGRRRGDPGLLPSGPHRRDDTRRRRWRRRRVSRGPRCRRRPRRLRGRLSFDGRGLRHRPPPRHGVPAERVVRVSGHLAVAAPGLHRSRAHHREDRVATQ